MAEQSLKRKLEDPDEDSADQILSHQIPDSQTAVAQQQQRKKKKKKHRQQTQRPGEEFDDKNGLNLAVARMAPLQLVEYVESRTKQFQPGISAMELEDQQLPVARLTDTTSWTQLRSLDRFASFLEHFAGGKAATNLAKAAKEPGSPHTLVIAGAGLRAADITRVLRKFQNKDAIIAKLFAKHIKLKESIELCSKKRINIGVGTPQRIIDLLEDGCLSAKALERIVIDASHIDQKRRGLLEMKDTLEPTIRLLNLQVIRRRLSDESGAMEILFY